MFFELGTAPLGLVLVLIIGGSSAVGVAIGRRLRAHQHEGHESVGVVQGTLLGLVGLLLAFGLTMAVNRYEGRRALVVEEANAIETTYLRAELLAEPSRTHVAPAAGAVRGCRHRPRRTSAGDGSVRRDRRADERPPTAALGRGR